MENRPETKRGMCRLCSNDGRLVASHIVPKSFFQIDPNSLPSLISNTEGSFPKKAPSGVYDYILCDSCERSFSDYDSHAAKILIHDIKRYVSFRFESEVLAYTVPHADYRLMKLFAIATLWRASVSTHNFYRRVALGPFEAVAREMLIAREPGDAETFSTWWSIFKMDWTPGIMDPFREKWSGVTAYRFYLGRVLAYIKVDQRPTPDHFAEFNLRPGRPLTLIARRFETSKDLKAMKAVALSRRHAARR